MTIQKHFEFVKDVLEVLYISLATIFPFNKLLAQITITLVVPLVISIAVPMHMIITRKSLFQAIIDMCYEDHYNILYITISMTTITIFYILSTSVIVYITASLNKSKDVTYLKVIKVVPRVWKRLTVTFFHKFCMLFAYNLISWVLMNKFVINVIDTTIPNDYVRHLIIRILSDTYYFGLLYVDTVSQFACVISILETSYGTKAMIEAKHLLKGGMIVPLLIQLLFYAHLFLLWLSYWRFALHLVLVWRVLMGTIVLVLLVIWFLLFMVTQTKLYFAYKEHANLKNTLLRANLINYSLYLFKDD